MACGPAGTELSDRRHGRTHLRRATAPRSPGEPSVTQRSTDVGGAGADDGIWSLARHADVRAEMSISRGSAARLPRVCPGSVNRREPGFQPWGV